MIQYTDDSHFHDNEDSDDVASTCLQHRLELAVASTARVVYCTARLNRLNCLTGRGYVLRRFDDVTSFQQKQTGLGFDLLEGSAISSTLTLGTEHLEYTLTAEVHNLCVYLKSNSTQTLIQFERR